MLLGLEIIKVLLIDIRNKTPNSQNHGDHLYSTNFLMEKDAARTGTIGKPKTLMALENKEDTSKIKPTQPIAETSHIIAVQTKVMI